MTSHDEFATWDGAYVLGSLSPADRRAYEAHLATCGLCAASVNELAGLPGLLARVPAEKALALVGAQAPVPVTAEAVAGAEPVRIGTAPDALPKLVHAARRHRARVRWWTAGSILVAAAVLAFVGALVLPGALAPSVPQANGTHVSLSQVEPNPLSADVRLISEPWGTRIETKCSYAEWKGATSEGPWKYTMVVTDRKGSSMTVSSWTASAGTTVSPTATTSVPVADIASIDIRAADGEVLLKTTFE
ncbi:anti-sigma factor family protein [Diaminobutyricibacter sp. McL0608]|uniref:anti-sigma factor family protein n=1 Tax=Leifsonia sp. McL0608 TaxID=3143537 RepID=UPI0031F303CB